ncbi:MAG: MarR family transcriptional regulator [Propionibacteriaceae bacterium]|jgi:DNA-binding MarR family transcriptional regulator|nr:MarR family transcriptional regulator [Propionibacteriaceae bacterium]
MNGAKETDTAQAAGFATMVQSLWQEATLAARSRGGLPVLPPAQALALRLVIDNDDVTPTVLAGAMRLSRPMVSEIVRKLEAQKLIQRRRSHLDGRSVVLTATAKGRYVRLSFTSGVEQAMDEAFSRLSAREVQQVTRALPALQHLRAELIAIADRERAAALDPDPEL